MNVLHLRKVGNKLASCTATLSQLRALLILALALCRLSPYVAVREQYTAAEADEAPSQ